MNQLLKSISTLGKFTISLPVSFTAFTGYTLFSEQLNTEGLLAALGIFFMSAGASGINQVQEVAQDRLMSRTSDRPLPKERFTLNTALTIIGLFILIGTLLLNLFNMQAVFWGWMGLVWYNLVYTPLKTKTAFSAFPGAIVGAIPPIAGWVAAGGSIIDVRIHFLAFFFFLGQMPHFWLLVLKYKKQYKNAGFPVITDHLTNKQLFRINMIWSIATLVSVLFLPLLNIITSQVIETVALLSVIIMTIWVITSTYSLHQVQMKSLLKKQFIFFNSFYLWIMILLLIEQF